jgi:hypothetical protein
MFSGLRSLNRSEEDDRSSEDYDHVPIHNIELMQMLQRAKQLSSIKAAPLLVKPALSLKMVEELSAVD